MTDQTAQTVVLSVCLCLILVGGIYAIQSGHCREEMKRTRQTIKEAPERLVGRFAKVAEHGQRQIEKEGRRFETGIRNKHMRSIDVILDATEDVRAARSRFHVERKNMADALERLKVDVAAGRVRKSGG